MRGLGLVLAGCLVAGAALADTPDIGRPGAAPKPSAQPKYPRSVWRLNDDRTVEHLQSGLLCHREVFTFRAQSLQTYDRYGLDVSCGYGDGQSVLTVYLTHAGPDIDLGAIYAAGKAAILKVGTQKHPMLLSEDKPGDGGLGWMRATFGEDGGMRTSLWMARLRPDWIVQYRATYPEAREASVFAALREILAQVQASPGERLKLCAAHPAPDRAGVLVTDPQAQKTQAAMTSILEGAAAAQAQSGKPPPDAAPAAWCAEGPASAGGIPMLFWRGVRADGSDARMDRLTAMTMGPAPELDIGLDSTAALVAGGAAKGAPAPERWTAETHLGAQTWIFAYFDGRPDAAAAAALFADVLHGKARPIGGYSGDRGQVTISTPGTN